MFLAALWLAGLDGRWRTRLLAVAVIALALPPFLVTNCWLDFLGLGGRLARLAAAEHPFPGRDGLDSEPADLADHAADGLERLAAAGALATGERHGGARLVADSRPALAARARTALAQAAVLTFVLALNNFAVPAILQVKVFPAEMWVRFNTTFDTLGALQLSWPLVLAPLLLLLWFARRELPWPRTEGPVSARLFRQQLGPAWFWLCRRLHRRALPPLRRACPCFRSSPSNGPGPSCLAPSPPAKAPSGNSLTYAAVSAAPW